MRRARTRWRGSASCGPPPRLSTPAPGEAASRMISHPSTPTQSLADHRRPSLARVGSAGNRSPGSGKSNDIRGPSASWPRVPPPRWSRVYSKNAKPGVGLGGRREGVRSSRSFISSILTRLIRRAAGHTGFMVDRITSWPGLTSGKPGPAPLTFPPCVEALAPQGAPDIPPPRNRPPSAPPVGPGIPFATTHPATQPPNRPHLLTIFTYCTCLVAEAGPSAKKTGRLVAEHAKSLHLCRVLDAFEDLQS